ncbi:MAG: sigma-70 family RNA polymerase sigma factor [Ruminococcus sp.]|jgi:RNA polymerase sigma factor (sigma-70 family)|nr:sigma-70 family RNA polymerase sigma factor [Ruminococcus sp.]
MRKFKISLSESVELKLPQYDYVNGSTNNAEIEKMKNILRNAIASSLTERQRYCICRYYLDGIKMKKIAEELNIYPSTVSRHIDSAKRNLKKIADCYC